MFEAAEGELGLSDLLSLSWSDEKHVLPALVLHNLIDHSFRLSLLKVVGDKAPEQYAAQLNGKQLGITLRLG